MGEKKLCQDSHPCEKFLRNKNSKKMKTPKWSKTASQKEWVSTSLNLQLWWVGCRFCYVIVLPIYIYDSYDHQHQVATLTHNIIDLVMLSMCGEWRWWSIAIVIRWWTSFSDLLFIYLFSVWRRRRHRHHCSLL